MTSENIFTIVMAILTVIGSIVGVWAVTRKNASEVQKVRAFSEAKVIEAETKERADLIEMLKESGKQSITWLETLKVTEHKRELDYATLKAIVEDGTKETINTRKELAAQAKEHNTGITKTLDEVKNELASIKSVVEKMPGESSELRNRLDRTLGYIERLLPKLRTSEVPAAPANGTLPEPTPSTS